ncbi:MAG: HAD hydrolase-like protein [Bacillota bacterium]
MIPVVLWDLDGTIQDSESLAKEGTRYGFKQVLGREPTEAEFAQLVGRPVPVVYKEWFDDDQPSDIRAADAARMKGIAALWGDGMLERLEPMCPTMLAYTPRDILNFL